MHLKINNPELAKKELEEIPKRVKIIKAALEGKAIQYSTITEDKWHDTDEPIWAWDTDEYRVKPEPLYRPFTNTELCKYLDCYIFDGKNKSSKFVVFSISKNWITLRLTGDIVKYHVTRETLLEDYTFSNGTKCGVKL
jgi:hypothetical protein